MKPTEKQKEDISSLIERTLDNERTADYDEVNSRIAKGENRWGISLSITGVYIPVKPILEEVSQNNKWLIESIGMAPGKKQRNCPNCEEKIHCSDLIMFCVPTEKKESPLSSIFIES